MIYHALKLRSRQLKGLGSYDDAKWFILGDGFFVDRHHFTTYDGCLSRSIMAIGHCRMSRLLYGVVDIAIAGHRHHHFFTPPVGDVCNTARFGH